MRRGTTPKHVFEVPLMAAEIKRVEITYNQKETNLLTKTEEDCSVVDGEISVTLTQEETLQFEVSDCVFIQLRVLLTDDTALASDVIRIGCTECLSDEVLR